MSYTHRPFRASLSMAGGLLAAGLLALPHLAAAQDARIIGRITSAESGEPIAGAEVYLKNTNHRSVTSKGGLFELDDLPAGQYSLAIHYLGAESEEFTVRLSPREKVDVAFRLEMRVIPVPELTVTVDQRPPVGKLYGFYRRSESGPGYFLTRDDIADSQATRTTDLLRRVPGLDITGRPTFDRTPVTMSRKKGCVPDFYVDGAHAPFFDVDDIPPRDLAGVEVYRGNSEVPVEFKHADRCGVIVLWTRDPANWRGYQ